MAKKKIKLNLKKKLSKFVTVLTKAMTIDQIILFGSQANETAHKHSDIDLAVVSPELDKRGPMIKNVREVKEKSNLIEPGLQLFAFSSDLFYKKKSSDQPFIHEIKKTGKVIYSRQSKQ